MTEAMTQLHAALSAFETATGGCQTVDDINALNQALEQLACAALEADQLGLQDCAAMLQQHLDDVAASGSITPGQIDQLRMWAEQAGNYLHGTDTAAACKAMVGILGNQAWPAPMSAADAEVLREMLAPPNTDQYADLQPAMTRLMDAIRAIDDEEPATLQAAAAELEQFSQALGDAGEMGLQDCALLLQQNIEDLAADAEPLTDVQKTLLTAWAGLTASCLNKPNDKSSRAALIANLCNTHWPAALTAADAAVLYDLFGIQPAAETPSPAKIEQTMVAGNVVPFPVEPKALAILDASLAQVEVDNPTTITSLTAPLAELADNASEMVGLQDICLLLQQQLEDLVATDTGLSSGQIERIRQWTQDVRRYLADPADRAAADSLLTCLSDDCWPNPLDKADIDIIREMLTGESAAIPAAEAQGTETDTPGATPVAESAPGSAVAAESDAARSAEEPLSISAPSPQPVSLDLIDMLASEIMQMHDDAKQLYEQLYAADLTPALRSDSLSQYAVRTERFANASQAAELAGLQQACEIFHRNIHDLDRNNEPLTERQIAMLRDWPEKVGDYLAELGDAAASQALVDILLDEDWVEPLLPDLAKPLVDLLAATYISDQALQSDRMQTATAADVSLTLPDDINQELLEGLLQELPQQTERFSAAIQALSSGNGSRRDLEQAQRVAHTIKGAANTVGVRGIANLTHQIEDLLVMLVEHDRMPSQALSSSLVDAADCLEEMSEALLDRQGAPQGSQQTLQMILDWVNRLERDGVEAMDSEPPLPAAADKADASTGQPADKPSDRPSASTEEDEEQTATLRVPANLIDDLLRLVGETLILTAQLQEKVHQSTQQNESLLAQHDLFQELVGELEQQVDVGGIAYKLANQANDSGFDTLELEQYNELHTVTHRLVEAAADSVELDQDIGQYLRSLDELLINQSRLQREVQDLVMRTRMIPLKTIVPRLQRAVRQTCRVTGKQADLVLEGTDTLLDSDILNSLVDPLMHILRNAVDHGIESREERIRKDKDPNGTIQLSCHSEGTQVVLRCRDDGAGLDLDAIRALAEKRGLIQASESLSEDELRRLILRPGFSTRSETTQTSGRGIGMDIVATQLQVIKGSIMIHSEPGQGTEFELRLPVSLMTTHGLLVRIRKQVMAISTRGIEQILHPDDGVIEEEGDHPYYELEGERLDFHQIDDLLQLPRDRRSSDRNTRPALLIREEALNCAVQVENVIDSRDLVVKPLGPYLKKIRGIVGATILGDGSVVPVLDLPELIRTPHDTVLEQADLTDTGIQRSLPVALVVDDSISARRTLAQVVRDAGYEIRTAKDGLEAATLIEKKYPDIVLTDLEMPRMNGIELASHLKANAETSDIPIIMITSRSTDKHRQLAQTSGVDIYLNKPFSEDELLQHVHDLLEKTYSTSA